MFARAGQLDVHRHYCDSAAAQLSILNKPHLHSSDDHAQAVLDSEKFLGPDTQSPLGLLSWWEWNCGTLHLARNATKVFPTNAFLPRRWPDIPLAIFMLHAAPEQFISWSTYTFGSWLGWKGHTVEHWQQYLDTLQVRGPPPPVWGTRNIPVRTAWEVRNVPGTIAPVKADKVWVQVPTENSDSTVLVGAWKVSKDSAPTASSNLPLISYIMLLSSRSRWRTTGTRLM